MTNKKTKVVNFYQLKGGVGKTTLTCMVANELIWQHIMDHQSDPENPKPINEPLRVMVLDIDTQNSISVIRGEEVKILKAAASGDDETHAKLVEKKPWHRNLFSRYQYLYSTYGWRSFDEIVITMSESSVEKAIQLIESNEYDYVFMDFPGSYDQDYTGNLLLYSEYLLIPCDLNSQLDVAAAQKFLQDIESVEFYGLRHIAFVANKHRINSVRNRRNQEAIETETEIKFMETKVKYCEYFKTEYLTTVYPRSVDLNLNTRKLTVNSNMASIIELAHEITNLM